MNWKTTMWVDQLIERAMSLEFVEIIDETVKLHKSIDGNSFRQEFTTIFNIKKNNT